MTDKVLALLILLAGLFAGCSEVVIKGGDAKVSREKFYGAYAIDEICQDGTVKHKNIYQDYPLEIPGDPQVIQIPAGFTHDLLAGVDFCGGNFAPWLGYRGLGLGPVGLDLGSTVAQGHGDTLTFGGDLEQKILGLTFFASGHFEQPWKDLVSKGGSGSLLGVSLSLSFK